MRRARAAFLRLSDAASGYPADESRSARRRWRAQVKPAPAPAPTDDATAPVDLSELAAADAAGADDHDTVVDLVRPLPAETTTGLATQGSLPQVRRFAADDEN